ncbi:hypothetical protein NL676_002637 [Syzygium grande]|nr:hypothetical protein NL676_002637 [Syzygium grande]
MRPQWGQTSPEGAPQNSSFAEAPIEDFLGLSEHCSINLQFDTAAAHRRRVRRSLRRVRESGAFSGCLERLRSCQPEARDRRTLTPISSSHVASSPVAAIEIIIIIVFLFILSVLIHDVIYEVRSPPLLANANFAQSSSTSSNSMSSSRTFLSS